MTDLVNRLLATSETGVTPELIDEAIQRIRELEATIERARGLQRYRRITTSPITAGMYKHPNGPYVLYDELEEALNDE